MEEIRRQVGRARRRLVLEQFFRVFGWSLFTTLLLAAIGLAIPRIWALPLKHQVWDWSWIGGGIAAGFVVAGIWTYLIRRSRLDAAIELDRRYGLKERVSSTLALTPDELGSDIGKALMTDAVRRVERIDVREQFRVSPTWRILLPLAPAIALIILALLPNAAMKQAGATSEQPAEIKKQIKTATQKLQEKIRESQKKAEEQGLKDTDILKDINRELDKLANRDAADRKDALLKINDLAKEIEKRKHDLGAADKMRKELDKLKDVAKGPADKTAEALREGDFGKAREEMQKLMEDLAAGKLSKEDQEKLAQQLQQMKDKLQQAAQEQKESRERLQQQIDQKLADGNIGEAAKLQQQLDKMNQNAEQQEQMMQQLAEKLGMAAQALQEGGDPQQAIQQLDKLSKDLQKMQDQLDQLQNLQDVLDQLADAKEAMKCPHCEGAGCAECQGNSGDNDKMGKDRGKGDKNAKNKGRGEGLRDEEQTDTSKYNTRVAADPKAGESVRIGDASGPNKAGKTLEAIKEEIQSTLAKPPDALEDTTLPRDQRENAKQYFEKIRKGE
jgi:DNA repair exonuclease SbcCD ATPase subunit